MPTKKKLLAWSDGVNVGTGFGTVSRHVLRALHELFEIDQLAINYNGEFLDKSQFPYQLVPARLQDPKDPYGKKMFYQSLGSGQYDYVWIMNDNFVVEEVGKNLNDAIRHLKSNNKKIPKIVYYFPVDCKVLASHTSMLKEADVCVAYCDYGQEKTLDVLPEIKDKLVIINHGVDSSEFFPIDPETRKALRKQFFNIEDDKFVWMQANRNSIRKDIAKTLLAFSEFKKKVTDHTALYLHTAAIDTTINLNAAVEDLGLVPGVDVIFPRNFSASKPFSIEVLNYFYNCGDAFITTTLGEGWGLTHLEAAAAGLPLVCPRNTCFLEQLGNQERGFLYECKEQVWIDNSGYRPLARTEDIVDTMSVCWDAVMHNQDLINNIKSNMNKYLNKIQWKTIGDQWIDLFKKIDKEPKALHEKKTVGELI